MQLALLFGNNGDRIRSKYKAMHDDIVCDCYRTIPDFISACEARGITYDRVIMVSSVVKPTANNDFVMLEDFVRTTPATVYVMIARKGTDDEFAKLYVNTVNSSAAVAMLVTSTTQITLEEALTLSADEINSRYGCIKHQTVEIEREDYEVPEEPEKPIEEQSTPKESEKPVKKKGFFARLKEANQIVKQQKAEQAAKAAEMANSQISANQNIQEQPITPDNYVEEPIQGDEYSNDEYSDEEYAEESNHTSENDDGYYEDGNMQASEEYENPEDMSENFEDNEQYLSSDDGFDEGDDSEFFTSQGAVSEVSDENFADSEYDNKATGEMGMSFEDDTTGLGDSLSDTEDDSAFFTQMQSGIDTVEDASDNSEFEDDFADLTPISDEDMSSIQGEPVESKITEIQEEQEVEAKRRSRLDDFFKNKSFDTQQEETSSPEMGIEDNIVEDDFSFEDMVSEVNTPAEEELSFEEEPKPESEVHPEPVRTQTNQSGVKRPTARPQRQVKSSPASETKRSVPAVRSSGEIVEVDDDLFSDIDDIIGLDEEYQQEEKKKNVKVVERVVEREVIKEVNVGGSSKSILTSIFKGKTKKIILVTGSRGSGVTTLAFDIANYFTKHCPVLYVDGDTEMHGLLNYVDYQRVTDYEQNKLQGTRLCRSAAAFANCVIRFDRNLDLLTSDFFVETSDDEYEVLQSTVTDVSRNYGIVVCDIPLSKLHLCEELIASSNIVLTAEFSQRGYMNLCCEFQSNPLRDKYKRTVVSRGTLALTKCEGKKFSEKDLKRYVAQIVEFEEDDADWTSMKSIKREKNISNKFLEEILEG